MNEELDSLEIINLDPKTRSWVSIRGECVSGGEFNDSCNLVVAAQGGDIQVIRKVLSCGCILVPEDTEDGELFV